MLDGVVQRLGEAGAGAVVTQWIRVERGLEVEARSFPPKGCVADNGAKDGRDD
jgi:hypothetical protein